MSNYFSFDFEEEVNPLDAEIITNAKALGFTQHETCTNRFSYKKEGADKESDNFFIFDKNISFTNHKQGLKNISFPKEEFNEMLKERL